MKKQLGNRIWITAIASVVGLCAYATLKYLERGNMKQVYIEMFLFLLNLTILQFAITAIMRAAALDEKKKRRFLEGRVNSLYWAVEHGDVEHRQWLWDKIDSHFSLDDSGHRAIMSAQFAMEQRMRKDTEK